MIHECENHGKSRIQIEPQTFIYYYIHVYLTHILENTHTHTMAGLSKSQKKKWYYAMFLPNTGTPPQPLLLDRTKFLRVLQNAISINSKPTPVSFPELPSVIVWMRCFIAVIYGTTLGIRNVRGSLMILNAINLITFVPYMYGRFYLNVTMETYNNHQLLFVGVLPAVALTLLIWIYYFTLHHEMEIEVLTKFLLDAANTNATIISNHTSNEDGTLRNVMEVTEVPPLTEDSEF
jgi:hypothetical protein